VTVVRDLGVWLDAELSMRSHVSRVAQTCFTICVEYVPFDDSSAATYMYTARLVTVALVLSRLDYCNAVLAGLSACGFTATHAGIHFGPSDSAVAIAGRSTLRASSCGNLVVPRTKCVCAVAARAPPRTPWESSQRSQTSSWIWKPLRHGEGGKGEGMKGEGKAKKRKGEGEGQERDGKEEEKGGEGKGP